MAYRRAVLSALRESHLRGARIRLVGVSRVRVRLRSLDYEHY